VTLETRDELEAFLGEMIQPGLWGQLLARGSAWSLMRQDGVLRDGAPAFGRTIDADLAEYAFSVLRAALALKDSGEGRVSDCLCKRRPGPILERKGFSDDEDDTASGAVQSGGVG